MKTLTANDAKCGLGPLIELPVAGAKHGRPVVVVMAVEDFELLKALESPAATRRRSGNRISEARDGRLGTKGQVR